jgi:signal transduction histidine kinase
MSLSLAATLSLDLLALAVFMTAMPRRARAWTSMIGAAVASGTLAVFGWLGDAASVGAIVIAFVSLHLWTRCGEFAAACGTGLLIGCTVGALMRFGVEAGPATLGALTIAAVIFAMARHWVEDASPTLQIEAMLLLLIFAVLVAAAPEVAAGWHSAVALNAAQGIDPPRADVSADLKALFLLCGVALVGGAGYAIRERRKRC